MTDRLRARITTIPGPDGWWHTSNARMFWAIAETLLGHGLSEDQTFEILESAYGAVADEFGA